MHTMDNKTLSPPAQSSIRSFFKPKSPNYTSLPSAAGPPKTTSTPPTTTLTAPPASSAPPSAPPTSAPSPAQQPTTTTAAGQKLHPQASISPILPSHIAALKRINALLLCITYPDSFYTKILAPSPPPSFSRAILWSSSPSSDSPPTLVGGVVCRVEECPSTEEGRQEAQLYIQSLTLLSPYRHLGLASAALTSILTSLVSAPSSTTPITSLYAHVWTENTEGLEWYKARGFEVEGGVVTGYYRKLSPDTAWVLRRRLGARDYLQYGGSVGANSSIPILATNGIPVSPASNGPPQGNGNGEAQRRPPPKTGNSYQNAGPGMEWNDLPTDILLPTTSRDRLGAGSGVDSSGPPSSAVSSRSSSVMGGEGERRGGGGKKKRVYPAAAFGS